jgi:hypothetical protein
VSGQQATFQAPDYNNIKRAMKDKGSSAKKLKLFEMIVAATVDH